METQLRLTQECLARYSTQDVIPLSGGTLRRRFLDSRPYYLFVPTTLHIPSTLMIYYHGSRGNALCAALLQTTWLEEAVQRGWLVAFGQALGTPAAPIIDVYGSISHGELYWEIRDGVPGFAADLAYTKALLADCSKEYSLAKTYFVGHSNGGVFACLLAIYLPELTALVSCCGGLGFDPHFYLDFAKNTGKKPAILFSTGTQDLHQPSCHAAWQIFCAEGYPSEIITRVGRGHECLPVDVKEIVEWLARQ